MPRSLHLSAPDSCKVATPRDLATAMVEAVGTKGDSTWLEPCVGEGVFVELLKERGISKKRIRAIDLDLGAKPNDEFARTLRGREFLQWANRTRERFDRIVSNPPYVSLSSVDARIVDSATSTLDLSGQKIPKAANLWYAFTCAMVRLLKKNGNIAIVLPAAWDFADYANELREKLPYQFQKFGVFRAAKPLFEDVLDGSVVIVGIGYQKKNKLVARKEYLHRGRFVRSVVKFRGSRSQSIRDLPSNTKTSKTLGDYVDIRIGGVTGQSDYFLLTEEDRLANNLPLSSVTPVLSKSSHLSATATKSSWQELRHNSERIWLFRPSGKALKTKAVQEYLNLSIDSGGCDQTRYKIRNRDPWYMTRLEERVDGFVSGMSSLGPWICFNEMKNLNATNTLYTVRFRDKLSRNERFTLALFLLTSRVQKRMQKASRRYAQGLSKLEPSDLSGIEIGNFPKCSKPVSTYRKCIALVTNGEKAKAVDLADVALGLSR